MNIDHQIENLNWAAKILQKERNIALMLQGTCHILRTMDNEIKDLQMKCDARTDVTITTVEQIMALHETVNKQKELLRAAVYCLETCLHPDTDISDIGKRLKEKIWDHLEFGKDSLDTKPEFVENVS